MSIKGNRQFIKADYNNKIINKYKRSTDPDWLKYEEEREESLGVLWAVFCWIVFLMVIISSLIWIK